MATRVDQTAHARSPVAPTVSEAWLRPSKREGAFRRILAVADLLGILVGFSLALFVVDASYEPRRWIVGVLTLPAWIVLFKAYGLYDRDDRRVSHSTVDDVPWLFHALLVGTILLGVVYWAATGNRLSFLEGLAFFVVALVAVLTARAGARAIALVAIPGERVLLLGGGTMAAVLVDKIRTHPEYGLELVGYVDAHSAPNRDLQRRFPYLGRPTELEKICRENGIDRIIVVAPSVDDGALAELIRRTHSLDVRISLLPQLSDLLGSSVVIDDIEGVTVLGINPPSLNRSSRFLKRAMDVAIALVVLVLMLPFLALIAVAIKMTSPGPVFFTQSRVGRRGRQFRIVKFRTMAVDAEQRADELRQHSTHPAWLKLEHDPRVTRMGRFLRHTSLDELPQLWNVLKGEMSLVGPRPMPLDVDEKIAGWGRRRLDLTPGLTGLWQVLGRTNIPFEEMVKLDYLYVSNWSLWQDFRLLIHTLPAVARRRGVN
jgi:exopolysaccharide biosynthesis polyprenyl glycosylphosphotransferase